MTNFARATKTPSLTQFSLVILLEIFFSEWFRLNISKSRFQCHNAHLPVQIPSREELLFLSGHELESLKAALLEAANHGSPQNPPLPEQFRHYRSDLGRQLFGEEMGILRDNIAARNAVVLRNFDFFGAPLVGITYMDKSLSHIDSLGVGMWLQTLILELTEQGLDTCVEDSIAGFPQVIERQRGIASI